MGTEKIKLLCLSTLFCVLHADKKCKLETDVQYLTCKNGDNSKFNGGKIKTKSHFQTFSEGVPDGVTCWKVQCSKKTLNENDKPVKKTAVRAGCVDGKWMIMRKKKGQFESTEDLFVFPDCPSGCMKPEHLSLLEFKSKSSEEKDGKELFDPNATARAKCICKKSDSGLWTAEAEKCKKRFSNKCLCRDSGCFWKTGEFDCGELTQWSKWSNCNESGLKTKTRSCIAHDSSNEKISVNIANCGLTDEENIQTEPCAQIGQWTNWSSCSDGSRQREKLCMQGNDVVDSALCSEMTESQNENCETPIKWTRKMMIKMSSAQGRDNHNAIMAPYDMSWAEKKYGKPFEKCCATPRAAYDGLHNANCAARGGKDNAGNPYFLAATGECISNVKTHRLAGSFVMANMAQPYNITRIDVAINPLHLDHYKHLKLYVAEDEYDSTGKENVRQGIDCGVSTDLDENGIPLKNIISFICDAGAVGQYAWLANPENISNMVTLEEIWVFGKTPIFSSFWGEWNFPEPCKGPDGGECTDRHYAGTVTRRRECIPPEALGSEKCPHGGESEWAGMITCPNRCREISTCEFTECSATCGGTKRKVCPCTNTGHGLPGKDYCANDTSIIDTKLYPCGPKCWEQFEAFSTLQPIHSDPKFSHIDCGTEGDDYIINDDGSWNVRFGVVCSFHCTEGYRGATSKSAVRSGVERTLVIGQHRTAKSWEYMDSIHSATAKRRNDVLCGTDSDDPFGKNALATSCVKISGGHPNRMECSDKDFSNVKFGISSQKSCTNGNHPGSICTLTCEKDWKPVDTTAMTVICQCDVKCQWVNTFSGSEQDWKKGSQVKCRKTNCGRPKNSNIHIGLWGWDDEQKFQCFRDDDLSRNFDELHVLETAIGPNDEGEKAYWPAGSYCREVDCPKTDNGIQKLITQPQPTCDCEYLSGGVISNDREEIMPNYADMRCKWSHGYDDIDVYCRAPSLFDDDIDPGCDPMDNDTLNKSGIKNWDQDHGLYCSHDPKPDEPYKGNYPLGTVCWFKCLPGYVHEEQSINHYGVPGQCHFAVYNNMFYNTWYGMGKNGRAWFPNCVKVDIDN